MHYLSSQYKCASVYFVFKIPLQQIKSNARHDHCLFGISLIVCAIL